jgi:hypothetical protein
VQANGFISIANLIAAANAELCAHPNTTASGVNRSCQEFLKTTLDNGNNNKNFVQPGPDSCPFTSPY